MRNNEQGRSMIEMLGVLAIIGVLSVGGLAGYAKAMGKYRINKTIDQVTNVVANTRILFGSQRTYEDLDKESATTIIEKSKMLPDSLKLDTDQKTLDNGTTPYVNAYSGHFFIVSGDRFSTGDKRAFVLAFTGIPEDACIELATQDWNASAGSGLLALGIEKAAAGAEGGNDALSGRENFRTSVLSGSCTNTISSSTTSGNTGDASDHMGLNVAPAQAAQGGSGGSSSSSGSAKVYCAETATDPISLADATSACTPGESEETTGRVTLYFKFY